ncbi:MAG: SPOR domain-containing protein [Gammaproteobacteria bacterium]|nr:SPOR domain-containing protein [Gammaproteobacteria bacterium]
MVTFHARRIALITLLAALTAACSREQQDWRSAEGADTTEGWTRFIEQHPNSELVPEARARLAEIAEARDWQHASRAATVAAYREFLARHPNGHRSEDARIRIEAFSLGSAPRIDLPSPSVADSRGPSGVPALQIATGGPAVAPGTTAVANAPSGTDPRVLAAPGEAAQAAPATLEAPTGVSAAAVSSEVPASAAPAMALAVARAGASPSDTAGYGVQLGAFGSEASADREWERLQGRFSAQLGGLSPRIILTSTQAGQLYRLQVAAAGEAQARALCDSLREQSQACVPVLPELR